MLLTSLCRQNRVSRAVQRARSKDAEAKLRENYMTFAKTRAHARQKEQLIEECEALLRQEGRPFTAVDWRAFGSRKRWKDGERGWTGLNEEVVRADVVEVRGRDVRGKTVLSKSLPPLLNEYEKEVFRAQFARSFPRAADRRIGTVDGGIDA